MFPSTLKPRTYYLSSTQFKDLSFINKIDVQGSDYVIELYLLSPPAAYPAVTQDGVWQATTIRMQNIDWWVTGTEEPNPTEICPLDLARWGMTSRRAWVKDSQGQILCHISVPPPANIRLPSSQPQSVRCECGADKCGSGLHSTWCPKYQART